MKRFLWLVLIISMLAVSPVLASDVSDAMYHGTVRATNAGSSASNTVATTFSFPTADAISNGFMADASDAVIEYNGSDIAFMPGYNGNPWLMWIDSIGASQSKDYDFYTGGVSGGKIRIFLDDAGMDSGDPAGMEPSGNYTWEAKGWLDTTAGTNKFLTTKGSNFRVGMDPTTDGTVTANITDSVLDFERDNSDVVTVPDNNAFSFTDGGGNDQPFSLTAWVRLETLPGYMKVLAKYTTAGNQLEWQFYIDATGHIVLGCYKSDGTAQIRAASDGAVAADGEWYHIAGTYDGSESANGIETYIDGALQSSTPTTAGTYTGMTNGTAKVEIGRGTDGNYDGIIKNAKVYSVELTPAEVLTDSQGGHKAANLVAWWKLNDGTGNPADSSGNGYNADSNTADWTTYSIEVSTAGETSVEDTVTVTANTSALGLYINGVLKDTATQASFTVKANADHWTSFVNGAMPYVEYLKIYIGGSLQQYIAWEYGATFTDLSGNGHDATPTLKTAPDDADITASLIDYGPTTEAKVSTFTLSSRQDILTEVPTAPAELYSELDFTTTPGAEGINQILAEGGVEGDDRALWWFPFIFFTIGILGLLAYGGTTHALTQGKIKEGQIDGSLLLMCVVIEVLLVAVSFIGPIPLWPAYLFPIPALALTISRKHHSWGG